MRSRRPTTLDDVLQGFALNSESWQARRLLNWWPANLRTGPFAYDPVTRLYGAFSGATRTVAAAVGRVIKLDSASSSYFSETAADAPYIGPITLVWWGRIDTGSNYRHFFGKHQSNGASDCPFDFRTDNAATPSLALVRAMSGANHSWSGPTVSLGVFHHIACVLASGDMNEQPLFYIDGVMTGGTNISGGAGTVTGTNQPIRVGRRDDGAVQMDGVLVDARIYQRVLTRGEIEGLVDPTTRWDLYLPTARRQRRAKAPAAAAANKLLLRMQTDGLFVGGGV